MGCDLGAVLYDGRGDYHRGVGPVGPPLALACARDAAAPAVVAALLEHGAAVDQARPIDGARPLEIACSKGHLGVARVLLLHGAAVNPRDNSDALWGACSGGHLAVVQLLLLHRADANATRTDGNRWDRSVFAPSSTPLFQACKQGDIQVARPLLGGGAGVNKARTSDGMSPLGVSAKSGRIDLVRLLLSYGARPSQACTAHRSGEAPIHPLKGKLSRGELGIRIAAVLIVFGADRGVFGPWCDNVTASLSGPLADFLYATGTWTPLSIGAECRLHQDVTAALRAGALDPDEPWGGTRSEGAGSAARAAWPVGLAWPAAAPVCPATARVVSAARRGWAPARHWLHHGAVRGAVYTVLLTACRLERASHGAVAVAAPATRGVLPKLPPKLWLAALRFVPRRHWQPTPAAPAHPPPLAAR